MATKDQRSGTRAPVVLRIKLRYEDVDTFVGKFATNISRGGMFIASRKPKDVDTTVRFELQLADGSPVIGGEGVVRWIREFDESKPRSPHGMGIEFTKLTEESAAALDRILEQRRERGLDEDAIPLDTRKKKRRKRKTKRHTKAPPVAEASEPEGEPKTPPARPAKSPTMPPPIPEDALANPEPAPEPAPEPPAPSHSAQTLAAAIAAAPDTGAWSDAALAELYEADPDRIAAMVARAREIAYSGGGDLDVEQLLQPSAVPSPVTTEDVSAALAGLIGGEPVAPRQHRAPAETDDDDPPAAPATVDLGDIEEPDGEFAGGTPVPPEVPSEAEPEPEPVSEPEPEPEPVVEAAPVPEPVVEAAPVPEPVLESDEGQTLDTPLDSPVPAPIATDYGAGDEATFVQAEPHDDGLHVEPDPTPLPPPAPSEPMDDYESQPTNLDDPLSHALAVDAMDADDLLSSGLDRLPHGSPSHAEADAEEEYTQEGPTNIVDATEIPTDVVSGDDEAIHRALEALTSGKAGIGIDTDEQTAVRDEPGGIDDDGIEIDLDDDALELMDADAVPAEGEESDDDDEKKKGFFRKLFGKN